MKRRQKLLKLLTLLCLLGAAVCITAIWRDKKPQLKAEAEYEKLRQVAFAENGTKSKGRSTQPSEQRAIPDFAALMIRNSDIKGWLYLPDTEINYPIVQGKNNEFYLNHTVDKKQSVVGSIFMEYKNNELFADDVTVLYGHHIKGGRMFSSLSEYKNQSYYEKHPKMYLYTPNSVYEVLLFAGQILDGQSSSFPIIFEEEKERGEWLEQLLAESTFQSDIRPETGQRILALCTCSYEYENARYVVYGVLR